MSKAPLSRSDAIPEIATVRVELRDTDPAIWRAVDVPTSITLKTLHEVIQAVMGWTNSHLWEFTIGDEQFGPPSNGDGWGDRPTDAAKVRLRDILRPRKTTISYLYDFGDSWEHRLTITKIRPAIDGLSYPLYLGGERNAPPEDCGGIPGFYVALEALADPNHPDHDNISEWFGDYDPDKVDVARTESELSRIASRRRTATRRTKTKTIRPA